MTPATMHWQEQNPVPSFDAPPLDNEQRLGRLVSEGQAILSRLRFLEMAATAISNEMSETQPALGQKENDR